MRGAPRAASGWRSEAGSLIALLSAQATPAGVKAGRIVDKTDFERLLATRSTARSAHFAIHHLDSVPSRRVRSVKGLVDTDLSTAPAPVCPQPVDELPSMLWIGCVVPKRHARRAVTRNLLKRQVRSAFVRHGAMLAKGLWLVRLRAPFAKAEFVSARSRALADAARLELDRLLLGRAPG